MPFQPLTPEQFQAARNANFSVDQIIANEKTRKDNFVEPASTSQPNIFQKTAGLFLNPIMEAGARTGQAVGDLALTGINKITGGALDKYTPEGNLSSALTRAENTPSQLPLTGGTLKPVNQETPESVVGRGVSTVALGLGSPTLAGGAMGLGSAMEANKGAVESTIDTAVSALGAKILEVGFSAASPYITKALAKYGTPLVEKLQSQLPDYAKPLLDKIINTGNTTLKNIGQKEFNAATDVVGEGGKIDFNQSRASAWKDLQPTPTPTTKIQYAKGKNVSEQGAITKAQLQPTQSDEPVIEAYQKLYDNGKINAKMSPKEKLMAVDQRAAELNQQQKGFLAANDKAVALTTNKSEVGLFNKLNDTVNKNSLVFSRDTFTRGAYNSTIDVFKRNLTSGKMAGATQGATTLTKIDEALTAFDKEMDKFGAWERQKTGMLTETDKARIQAIRDVHTTARDFIADNLPKNNPWKSIRLEESNLYRASDKLSETLGRTVGRSKLGEFMSAHPNLKRGALWVLGTGTIGELGRKAVTGHF